MKGKHPEDQENSLSKMQETFKPQGGSAEEGQRKSLFIGKTQI